MTILDAEWCSRRRYQGSCIASLYTHVRAAVCCAGCAGPARFPPHPIQSSIRGPSMLPWHTPLSQAIPSTTHHRLGHHPSIHPSLHSFRRSMHPSPVTCTCTSPSPQPRPIRIPGITTTTNPQQRSRRWATPRRGAVTNPDTQNRNMDGGTACLSGAGQQPKLFDVPGPLGDSLQHIPQSEDFRQRRFGASGTPTIPPSDSRIGIGSMRGWSQCSSFSRRPKTRASIPWSR